MARATQGAGRLRTTLAVLLAGAGGCSTAAPVPVDDAGSDAGREALSFAPCVDPLECADLRVPVDWAVPNGPSTILRVSRARALDGAAAGTVVLNPGGPGAPMIERFSAQYGLYKLGFGKALQRFEVVTWDVRGVGLSERLSCGPDGLYDRLRAADLALLGPSTTAVEALAAELRAGCTATALGAHVSTLDSARDLEALRVALRLPTLRYFGTSYGAVLGLAFASEHPGQLEAFVVDAPTVLQADLEEDLTAAAAARRLGLERFFTACAARPSCAFSGKDAAAVAARFDALVAAAPLPAGLRTLSRTDLGFALADGLRVGDPDKLGADLAKAEAGDATALLARADLAAGRDAGGHYDGSFGVHVATVCSDQRARSSDLAAFASFAAGLRAAEPRTGWMVVAPWSLCLGWPRVPPPAVGASVPALVVAGRNDPIVPFAGAEVLRARLGGAGRVPLLPYEGDGHPSSTHSGCVRDAITAFLLDPRSIPPASCPSE